MSDAKTRPSKPARTQESCVSVLMGRIVARCELSPAHEGRHEARRGLTWWLR